MDFRWTNEHQMIRKMVRDFSRNIIAPAVAQMKKQTNFHSMLYVKWANRGLWE